jgi:hypothetical protein
MFLSGALFILFLAGCWLLCLTDVATTPAAEFPGLSKRRWIAIIAATFVLGAVAWYLTRTRQRAARRWPQNLASYVTMGNYYDGGQDRGTPMTADAALARHPASQARRPAEPAQIRPVGPDDDPEFLRKLDRLISGSSDSSELPNSLRFLHKSPSTALQAGQTEQ